MQHATVALGQRITKPPRALLEEFQQRLIEYDRDKEKYERLSQTKMGELAYIHLQDMIPEESVEKWEKDNHNITTLVELRLFFTKLIRDFMASGSKRKLKGRTVAELAVSAEDLEEALPANGGGLLFQWRRASLPTS